MRKHDEVIRAWLDGKEMQCYNTDIGWVDFNSESMLANPITYPELEWRIKPKVRTIVIPTCIKLSNVNAHFDQEKMEIIVEFEDFKQEAL